MENQKFNIFYSWQSDKKEIKSFIEKTLRKSIKAIQDELNLSKNTIIIKESANGERGAVNITDTIFKRIDDCDLFVADLSIIDEYARRKYVNQNVMYELGYMIGKKTHKNVVLLFNTDTGKIEDLPFDIRARKMVSFSMNADGSETKLISELASIIKKYYKKGKIQHNEEDGLSEYEKKIIRLFKSMSSDKRLVLAKMLGGSELIPLSNERDEQLLEEINEEEDVQRKIAALNGLVSKKILNIDSSNKNNTVFGLTENGYKLIDTLS